MAVHSEPKLPKATEEYVHHGLVPEATRVKRNLNTKEERDNAQEGSLLKRVPRNIGRPKRYTPTKFRNRINDYFATCEKKECYPNIKGMMLHLGMAKDQFYAYDKYPEMKPIVEWARTVMEDWSMNDLWHTAISLTPVATPPPRQLYGDPIVDGSPHRWPQRASHWPVRSRAD